MVKKYAFLLLVLTIGVHCFGQPGQLTAIGLSDTDRIKQLTGMDTANRSFAIRPIGAENNYFTDNKWHIGGLTVMTSVQNNSALPYAYNEGSFYPSVGLQQRIAIGTSVHYRKFSLILNPEWVHVANKMPDGLDPYFDPQNYWPRYYEYVLNRIDLPDYFGSNSLQKLYPGQSSLKYTTDHFAIGISTENIWWGPGMRNSLIMTNSAPGFLHFTINTEKPLKTPIGSLEAQWIIGQLADSKTLPPENTRLNNGAYFVPRNTDTRTLTGLIVSWQPKWIANLYLGFAKSYYAYTKNTAALDLLPYGRINSNRQALGSLFIRYAMPVDHAELYIEYGRADRPATIANIFYDTIPSAYNMGVRKLFPLHTRNSYIEFFLEITHLQLPDARLIFQNDPALFSQAKSWYVNQYIRQGYTQDGRLLGASIGPGSNSQTLSVSWLKGINKIGIVLERVVHNNDFYYYNYFNGLLYPGPNFMYWADISAALQLQLKWKKFIVAGNLQYVSALNYKWIKMGNGGLWASSDITDKKNIQALFSILYKL